jgi:t-SNARE complex subunit (syntaxin)
MNVADKYQDVLALEASVAELHQMFLDFAVLTEQQGELLDQIEFQVKSTSDFIDEANQDLGQAIEFQKQIRSKQCCVCVICIVILGVIVGIIFAVTKPKV